MKLLYTAGAAGGALTDPEDIDLGTPLWRR